MSEILREFLSEFLTALLVAIGVAFQRWKAARDFENTRGQNEAIKRIETRQAGEVVVPPPPPVIHRRGKRGTGLLPRAPTPLPFWPVKVDAVPEPVEAETSAPVRSDS